MSVYDDRDAVIASARHIVRGLFEHVGPHYDGSKPYLDQMFESTVTLTADAMISGNLLARSATEGVVDPTPFINALCAALTIVTVQSIIAVSRGQRPSPVLVETIIDMFAANVFTNTDRPADCVARPDDGMISIEPPPNARKDN